jgi:hypothetical protein
VKHWLATAPALCDWILERRTCRCSNGQSFTVPAVPTCQVDEVQHGGLAGGVGEAHGQQGVGARGVGVEGGGGGGPVLAALCSKCARLQMKNVTYCWR